MKKSIAADGFKITGDYQHDLLKLLFLEALEGGVFAEESALLGVGAFEDRFPTHEEDLAFYHRYITHFEEATERKFLGDRDHMPEGEDRAPDAGLSPEAYQNELMLAVTLAQYRCEEAANWIKYWPGEKANQMRLTYAEILAFTAGQNAWLGWLEGKLHQGSLDEATAFLKAAEAFYDEEFLAQVNDLREDLAWLEES